MSKYIKRNNDLVEINEPVYGVYPVSYTHLGDGFPRFLDDKDFAVLFDAHFL